MWVKGWFGHPVKAECSILGVELFGEGEREWLKDGPRIINEAYIPRQKGVGVDKGKGEEGMCSRYGIKQWLMQRALRKKKIKRRKHLHE